MNEIINWKKLKLFNCAEVVLGVTLSTEKNEYWDGNILWITLKDLSNYVYISKGKRNISKLGLKNSNAKWRNIFNNYGSYRIYSNCQKRIIYKLEI